MNDGHGGYACNTCGTKLTFMSSVCPNCEQNRLLKENLKAQQDQLQQASQMARERQLDDDMQARAQHDQLVQQQVQQQLDVAVKETQSDIKNNFAELVLLIHTRLAQELPNAVDQWCKTKNAEFLAAAEQTYETIKATIDNDEILSQLEISLGRTEFSGERAKTYKKLFADYIINNSAYATQIALTLNVLDIYIKEAQLIDNEIEQQYKQRDEEKKIIDERKRGFIHKKNIERTKKIDSQMWGSATVIIVVLFVSIGAAALFVLKSLFR
jgi:hypothetical protein